MNMLHDISAGSVEKMNVIIEIPKGSLNKYEIDKETGMIALDRVMHTAQPMPVDYGFVPQTLWDDGDALDVIVLSTAPFFPGMLLAARPVGIMHMIDSGEKDDKVIAVPCKDPRFDMIQDLKDINPHELKTLQHFYENYKKLQNKEVVIEGFEGKEAAQAAFTRGQQLYAESKK